MKKKKVNVVDGIVKSSWRDYMEDQKTGLPSELTFSPSSRLTASELHVHVAGARVLAFS